VIMSIHFDEKGKFFTDVISKESVPVIVETPTSRIQGFIHIRPGTRLKDEINQAEPFFAVTEATIFDIKGKEIYRCDFLAISREHIVWILPEDQLVKNENGEGKS
jgi:Family of unknown function (DUF6812)